MKRIVLTEEWLSEMEARINLVLNEMAMEAEGRSLALMTEFQGHGPWSMKDATAVAGLPAKKVARITPALDFIQPNGKVSSKIRATVETLYGFNMDLLLYWNGEIYSTFGILLLSSEWGKVAAESNYKLEIACSKSMDTFAPPFMVWYYNNSKKVKGVFKVPTVPIDVGTLSLKEHPFNKGTESEPEMYYNGTSDITISYNLLPLIGKEVMMNGRVVKYDTRNFWKNGIVGS